MAKRKIDEAGIIADRLYTAAKEAGQTDALRRLIRSAYNASQEMYGAPSADESDETEEIPTIISKFADAWDERERMDRDG